MKKVFTKIRGMTGVWLALIIVVQTLVYVIAGANKAYFHMDEIYSYGLSNYERVQIYETEDFYGNWHNVEYYDEYLTVGEDERGDFWPVYENQKNDVHPPLFYGLLRLGVELTPERFSKWTGIVLNIVIAGVNTIMLWLVVRRLTGSKEKTKAGVDVRALVLTAMVALGMATVSIVIYVRMYELLTLWILLTTWLHLKLLAGEGKKWKLCVGIGVVEVLGALTQYYYWFYLVALFVTMAVRYMKRKDWKTLKAYAGTVIGAGLVSLLVWPYALQHMFFSNRGGGVLERFANPGMLLGDLWEYLGVVDKYAAHYLLLVAVLMMLILGARVLARGKKLEWSEGQRQTFAVVLAPVLFYLLIVTAVSPFIELRYAAPVCGLLLVLVALGVEQVVRLSWGEKIGKRVMLGALALFIVMPVVTGVQPDTMYSERAEVMAWAQEQAGVPALYFTKGEGDWVFLNDLPLFREFGDSYIVKDLQGRDEEKVAELKRILKGRDLSKGLIVVVNDDYDKIQMMQTVEGATGLTDVEHVARMVTSDVYYIKRVDFGM